MEEICPSKLKTKPYAKSKPFQVQASKSLPAFQLGENHKKQGWDAVSWDPSILNTPLVRSFTGSKEYQTGSEKSAESESIVPFSSIEKLKIDALSPAEILGFLAALLNAHKATFALQSPCNPFHYSMNSN